MGDYQAQLAKDRRDFANIARVKLREVGRRDISSFANVERVADLLGEWMMRLSDPKSETPVSVRDDTLPRLREILSRGSVGDDATSETQRKSAVFRARLTHAARLS